MDRNRSGNFFEYFTQFAFGRYCKNNYLSYCRSDCKFYSFGSYKTAQKNKKESPVLIGNLIRIYMEKPESKDSGFFFDIESLILLLVFNYS